MPQVTTHPRVVCRAILQTQIFFFFKVVAHVRHSYLPDHKLKPICHSAEIIGTDLRPKGGCVGVWVCVGVGGCGCVCGGGGGATTLGPSRPYQAANSHLDGQEHSCVPPSGQLCHHCPPAHLTTLYIQVPPHPLTGNTGNTITY